MQAIGKFILGLIIAAIVAYVFQKISAVNNELDAESLPNYEERKMYTQIIRDMRAQGKTQQEIKKHLKNMGLRDGVAGGMIIDVVNEQEPDLENPINYDWNGLVFKYPGNWKLSFVNDDVKQAGIQLESTSSEIIFIIDQDMMDGEYDLLREFRNGLNDPEMSDLIEPYRSLKGEGHVLKGTHKVFRIYTTVLFFQTVLKSGKHVQLVEMFTIEDEENGLKGIELFRNSIIGSLEAKDTEELVPLHAKEHDDQTDGQPRTDMHLNDLDELQGKLAELSVQIEEKDRSIDDLSVKLRSYEEQRSEQEKRIENLTSDLLKANDDVIVAEKENRALKEQLAKAETLHEENVQANNVLRSSLDDLKKVNNDKVLTIETLQYKIQNLDHRFEDTLREIDTLQHKIRMFELKLASELTVEEETGRDNGMADT